MPLTLLRNDITHMTVDAVVNAANEQLRHGGGVCGAIFAAAGAADLEAACARIGHCDTGSAVATPAFALNARHIIHTPGPVWRGGTHNEEMLLRSCYRSSLELARSLGDRSIAFPLISAGIYGYPKEQAIDVAMSEIGAFIKSDESDMDVYLILFDIDSMRAANGRFSDISSLISDLYARRNLMQRRGPWEFDAFAQADAAPAPAAPAPAASAPSRTSRRHSVSNALDELLRHVDAGFSQTLLTMIDKRGLKDSEVYKRANMSRQHFSKIRNNPRYRPKKATVLALAVALRLSLSDANLLLERAGYALTRADARDVIVRYFIERGEYDIYEINLALYAYDQPLLG